MPRQFRFGNMIPGKYRGLKANAGGKIMPNILRMQKVPGTERDWYRPLRARPKRNDKRGQTKPR